MDYSILQTNIINNLVLYSKDKKNKKNIDFIVKFYRNLKLSKNISLIKEFSEILNQDNINDKIIIDTFLKLFNVLKYELTDLNLIFDIEKYLYNYKNKNNSYKDTNYEYQLNYLYHIYDGIEEYEFTIDDTINSHPYELNIGNHLSYIYKNIDNNYLQEYQEFNEYLSDEDNHSSSDDNQYYNYESC